MATRLDRIALLFLVSGFLFGGSSRAHAAVKVMFVTSITGSGNLSSWPRSGGHTGLAAGDAICRSLAADAGLADAALFRAWLSTSTTDAYCHVAGFSGKKSAKCGQSSLPDAGPWQRVDGVSFSHRLSDLTSRFDVLHPPVVDENGATIPAAMLLTHSATRSQGDLGPNATYTCNDWQSAAGSDQSASGTADAGAVAWTYWDSPGCDTSQHLFCFDPGTGPNLPKNGTAPGAWVFVTSVGGTGDLGSWPQAGGATGIAAGDAICRSLATAGHLPAADTYIAWLSAAGAPAIDRITTDGPFRRPGGVQIAASKADLVALAPYLESDVESDELGEHISANVFTGTGDDGLPTGQDCGGWTQGGTAIGTIGGASSSGTGWTDLLSLQCGLARGHLLCFSKVVILFADDFESGDTTAWSSSFP